MKLTLQLTGLLLGLILASLAWGITPKHPQRHGLIGAPPPECPPEIPNCWPSWPTEQK